MPAGNLFRLASEVRSTTPGLSPPNAKPDRAQSPYGSTTTVSPDRAVTCESPGAAKGFCSSPRALTSEDSKCSRLPCRYHGAAGHTYGIGTDLQIVEISSASEIAGAALAVLNVLACRSVRRSQIFASEPIRRQVTAVRPFGEIAICGSPRESSRVCSCSRNFGRVAGFEGCPTQLNQPICSSRKTEDGKRMDRPFNPNLANYFSNITVCWAPRICFYGRKYGNFRRVQIANSGESYPTADRESATSGFFCAIKYD